MTTLHMEIERVRELARQMDQKALELPSKESNLRPASGRLSIAWHSPRADRLQNNFHTLIRYCEAQAQELQNLALHLSREVDEWEAVDKERPFDRWHDGKTIFVDVGDFNVLLLKGPQRSWSFEFSNTQDNAQGVVQIVDRVGFEKSLIAFIA